MPDANLSLPPHLTRKRLLITAGPTHEPIDAVRFIGNRSSGRLGIALADTAAGAGWEVTLLLGPTALAPERSQVRTIRFRTTADLQALLDEHWAKADVLIMAAAVADYRPKPRALSSLESDEKIRRTEAGLTIELESTPDLLARCGQSKRPDQLLIGFALEPRSRLIESASGKLSRKRLDMIVANPLETMDAPTVDAVLLNASGELDRTNGAITKSAFATWLLGHIARLAPTA